MSAYRAMRGVDPSTLDPAVHWARPGQRLGDHLRGTAEIARQFATRCQVCGDFVEQAVVAAHLHDVGKACHAFYLRLTTGKPYDHTLAGALLAYEHGAIAMSVVAAIRGHHIGLPNYDDLTALKGVDWSTAGFPGAGTYYPMTDGMPLPPAWALASERGKDFYTRAVLSVLCDADVIDAKRFSLRIAGKPLPKTLLADRRLDPDKLLPRLDAHVSSLCSSSPLSRLRSDVFEAAKEAGTSPPGFYTLTAPTGGAKTLAMAAFGLTHAKAHGMRRMVMVSPYLSLTGQTSRVLRDVFGRGAVLENHSNCRLSRRNGIQDPDLEQQDFRYVAETYNAPIVTTTNVQFFDSLHGNEPTHLRRLHRLARSVICLDEAHLVRPGIVAPVKAMLEDLVRFFECTVVFCSATQPTALLQDLNAHEMIPDVDGLYRRMPHQVTCVWPEDLNTPTYPWEILADKVTTHDQALCIVDSRSVAKRLYDLCASAGDVYHLSGRMSVAHREKVLAEVKTRLANGNRCRLVSTQTIECGADVDFPYVMRALIGLDRLVHSRGRCGRNGGKATFEVFVPPDLPPIGELRDSYAITQIYLYEGIPDLADPYVTDRYFARYYGSRDQGDAIVEMRERQQFRKCAKAFKVIDKEGRVEIVVPLYRGRKALADYETNPCPRTRRRLSRYTVDVTCRVHNALRRQGALRERYYDGLWILDDRRRYNRRTGLCVD